VKTHRHGVNFEKQNKVKTTARQQLIGISLMMAKVIGNFAIDEERLFFSECWRSAQVKLT